MKKILALLQFLPLSIFVLVARAHDFSGAAWMIAFQWGALASIIELAFCCRF